jgi:hypothetical protein
MPNSLINKDSFVNIEFNYASLTLEPYANNDCHSSKLLKELILKLNDASFPQTKRVIDRFANRKGNVKRNLVVISSPMEKGGVRSFGKIALIKNKAPQLLVGRDVIEEIEKPENKEFIEVTNYVINFNPSSDPIIMIEYNHEGPRFSDIEFYFRQISKDFKIAKSIKSSVHLEVNYNDLSKNIQNIFGVTVKLKASDLIKSQQVNWYKSLATLNESTGYKDARLEVFYQRKKEKNGKYAKNLMGLKFARNILDWLRGSDVNIDNVEDLKMTYQVDNNDEILELDFIKNKTTSIVSVKKFNQTQYKPMDYKFEAGKEFDIYLTSGQTTKYS